MGDNNETEKAKNIFEDMPDMSTRDYEKKIAYLSDYCAVNQMVPLLSDIINSGSDNAFDAFFCLCTLYRRRKDYEKMHELIESHTEFRDMPLYNHILVQYLVHSESFYDYDELLEMAFENTRKFPDNEGCCQAFCNAFVTICENCNGADRSIIIDKWFDEAVYCIDYAIEKDSSYAKFYMTKARILALQGKYLESEKLVKEAISKEDSSRHDYALTIGNYQSYRLAFQYERRIADLESRLLVIENKIHGESHLKDEGSESTGDLLPEPYVGDLPYAFISYAHKDSEVVYDVLRRIHSKGVRFWFDKGISPGSEWPEDLAKHLSDARTVVVMLTPSSLASANVRREVNFALSEEKNLVVIQLEAVDLTPGMKLQFGLYQMIQRESCTPDVFISMLTDALQREIVQSL